MGQSVRTWRRFATILRESRGGAEQRAREALGWSLRQKARGFAIPARVERRPGYSFGWDRLTGRLRAVLQAIDVREERGQAADDLYAYAGSLTGQLEYLRAQARSRNGRPDADHADSEYGGEDRLREVVFSDLESHEYWPIHRAVQ